MRFTGWSAVHFGLTVATCGLWLPVLAWSVLPAWVCQRCGANL